jgi:predicted SnoaL-like aldol condensation-catalyzing enzyme
MVEMFRTGDISTVRSIVSDSYLDHQGVGSGEIVGADGFGHVVDVARQPFEALDVSIEDLFAEADRAVARLRWRGTLLSGEVVERETIDIVRVDDGLAVEHWGAECWSTAADHE